MSHDRLDATARAWERGPGTALLWALASLKCPPTASGSSVTGYAAFAAGDRSVFEQRLTDDFLFSAPPDPRLDRDGYFERC